MAGENAGASFPLQSCNPASDCCIQSISLLNLKCNLQANKELPETSQGTIASCLGSSPGLFCFRKEGSRFSSISSCSNKSPCKTCIPNTPGQPHRPGTSMGSPHLCDFQHISIHVNASPALPCLFSWGLISGMTGSKMILAQALCIPTGKELYLVQETTEVTSYLHPCSEEFSSRCTGEE